MIHSCLVWFPWWLRHGAMDPIEGTSFVGLMSTDLTSEFTQFNLVIRLSKVQQMAIRFFHRFLIRPAAPAVPCELLWKAFLPSEVVPNSGNIRFFAATFVLLTSRHDMMNRQAHDLQVWSFSLFGFWWGETCCASNSLELVQPLHALVADWNTGLLWHNCTTFRF